MFFHVSGAEHTSPSCPSNKTPNQIFTMPVQCDGRYFPRLMNFGHESKTLQSIPADSECFEVSWSERGGYGNDTSEIIYGVDGHIGARTIPVNNILRTSDISYGAVDPDADPTQKKHSVKSDKHFHLDRL